MDGSQDTDAQPPADAETPRPSRSGRLPEVTSLRRRADERRRLGVAGLLLGALGRLPVTVLDVSASGALLRVEDERLQRLERERRSGSYLDSVTAHAAAGLTLLVERAQLRAPLTLVRWTSDAGPLGPYALGVAFEPPLSPEQVDALLLLRPPGI